MMTLKEMAKPPRGQSPIAVVAMACRLPGSCNNLKAFWDFLERGGIASLVPPETRFLASAHNDNSKKRNTMVSPGGMFIDADPRDLDASFFKLPKQEAIAMDPQQRQLLEVVYECLENAGLTLSAISGKPIGCFVGSYATDYGDIQARDPESRANHATLGLGRAMLSNRISHFLDIKGPSMTIDTACSGSLIGVDVANRYLQSGEISSAIVAGCNMYLSPEHVMNGLNSEGTASSSGRCHTFDAKADGYIKAEAVNVVILKRLDDALRDCDVIRGIIRGTATGSDGWTAGIASPSSEAQATTIRQAYENANITDLGATSYVECHGTGTKAGDPIEVTGIASVFSAARSKDNPLRIGSVKSNIGHSEPAAGLSGLLKVVLSMERGMIPGNPTFTTPNPNIDFTNLKLKPSRTNTPWLLPPPERRAGVNSFGYGGSNVHIIIDSADGLSRHISSYTDDIFPEEKTYDRPYILPFSANDDHSLKLFVDSLDKHLTYPGVSLDLRDLGYTLSERRTRHFYRGYVVTSTGKNLATSLFTGKTTPKPRIGLVFTGQGAQWPQMGKDLMDAFPVAKDHVLLLDAALQKLHPCPTWSLIEELSQPRSAEHYRQPEMSQTLVTALQLAILAVFEDCEVEHHTVVGHSSGEVAGAAAAGIITPEQAIAIAYYRGIATGTASSDVPVGMIAVGLGEDQAKSYLQPKSNVQIACINSPESITLSGSREELLDLEKHIKADGHFARMLHVDAAYHSKFMADPASRYRRLLQDFNQGPLCLNSGKAAMYSSVTGDKVAEVDWPDYWVQNMVSPVLFDTAVQAMLKESLDMLIEIGPSNALSGPINQIKKHTGSAFEYLSAWKRGSDALNVFCNLAGKFFIRGDGINLMRFNSSVTEYTPSLVVDLPNYQWNHATKYWHESTASKDWRFRKFVHHDLLGSKILGTPWQQPTWRKNLRVRDVPWLRDHCLGQTIVFPAAGYLAMAMEAAFQMEKALGNLGENTTVNQVTHYLRNCRFLKAMMLEDEGVEHEILLSLTPKSGPEKGWLEFTISNCVEGFVEKHSIGMIRILNKFTSKTADEADIQPLKFATSGDVWYKAMRKVGYTFGPSFQRSISVESVAGSRKSRSILSFEEPPSDLPQSTYPLHPTSIDACFQAVAGSIWAGDKTTVNIRLVPDTIDELIIPSQHAREKTAIATAKSQWIGIGGVNNPRSYSSDVLAYFQENKSLAYEMHGLRYQSLEAEEVRGTRKHVYNRSIWKPDITNLHKDQINGLLDGETVSSEKVNKLLDLIAFKNPGVKVLEVNGDDQGTSLWLQGHEEASFDRISCSFLHLELSSQRSLNAARSKYQALNVEIASRSKENTLSSDFDVLIAVGLNHSEVTELLHRVGNPGYVFIKSNNHVNRHSSKETPQPGSPEHDHLTNGTCNGTNGVLGTGSAKLLPLIQINDSDPNCSFHMMQKESVEESAHAFPMEIDVLHFGRYPNEKARDVLSAVSNLGWEIHHQELPFEAVSTSRMILVVDELFENVVSRFSEDAWKAVQALFLKNCKVLWVTTNSQMTVRNPDNGLIHGLKRSVCHENPNAIIMTLDVELGSITSGVQAIDRTLRRLNETTDGSTVDTEFAERGGVLYIERIVPDVALNGQERDIVEGAQPKDSSLFQDESCVRLISKAPGTLDSLAWAEVSKGNTILPDGYVEIDIHAVSLNFKDLAIVMGLIPGNEKLLGLDGAGIIRRLGTNTSPYRVGQRVLANRKGCLANRIQCDVWDGEVFPIPGGVPFDVASTLNTVYSTALYSIKNLSNVRHGDSVLIHSAAGGLGLAAVQICQHIGANIYATVGNDEKRNFLTETYGIPSEHIFSSRNADFTAQLMQATDGKGVDTILNTLSGELLHASWLCIAAGGTFVELGKRDILDRERISMEPFNRNASYRAADMSHDCITPVLKSKLLAEIFDLLEQGFIKPVFANLFSFQDTHEAFRLLSTGNSIGKIVITKNMAHEVVVPVIPISPSMNLKSDGSYFIVGGLKGLCGSIAIYLSRQGAKYMVTISRSGYDDETSKKVAADIRALGTELLLVTGDATKEEDIDAVFRSVTKPIRGIIQGAMVLRDKMFVSMTQSEFHTAIAPKVVATWNLHHVAQRHNADLDFFTMLSSICGLVGQKGQANYSAGNTFQDAFAIYRKSLGLPACSVNLGLVEEVGYVDGRDWLSRRLLAQGWIPIDEAQLHKIVFASVLRNEEQKKHINMEVSDQLVTGIPVPLPEESPAQRDVRFSTLRQTNELSDRNQGAKVGDDMSILRNALTLGTDLEKSHVELLAILIHQANKRLKQSLGLAEDIDPERPIVTYGIDSLVSVEFKNWTKMGLGVEIGTLDIVGAKTLTSLCKTILRKGAARQR